MTSKQKVAIAHTGAHLGSWVPLSIAKAIWNRRLLCLLVWLLLTAATFFIVNRLPPVYKAETSILIESQRIPENFVSATVAPDLQDRLNAISDQILSYSRLTELTRRFDLYRGEREHKTPEEIVDQMRSDIKIKADPTVLGAAGRPGAFQISYQGPDPVVVAHVAQQIGSFFIDENVRERSIEAEGTSEFLESQLAEAKKRLEEQEAMLSQFKLAHNGELPEQENALIASSGQIKTELSGIQDSINRAEQNKAVLTASLSDAQMSEATLAKMLDQRAPVSGSAAHGQPISPSQTESERLQEQLSTLQARYGDEYPDVRHVKEQLEEARQTEKKMATSDKKASTSQNLEQASAVTLVNTSRTDPQGFEVLLTDRARIANLKAQIEAADAEITNLEKQRNSIFHDLGALESHIRQLPVREQQLASVTRDYETTKAAYKSLLDKKLSADVATDMEKRQKAERFVMLDPARVPQKPIKPNRPMLCGIGCIAALAIAILLAVGLEFRTQVFLGEWELPPSIEILGRIPVLALSAEPRDGAGRT